MRDQISRYMFGRQCGTGTTPGIGGRQKQKQCDEVVPAMECADWQRQGLMCRVRREQAGSVGEGKKMIGHELH